MAANGYGCSPYRGFDYWGGTERSGAAPVPERVIRRDAGFTRDA